MGILRLLLNNLGAPRLTRPPAALPAPPAGYRGALAHESARCTGCAACAYACAPGAITLAAGAAGEPIWRYDAGRCTFCARCAAICPTGALALEATAPPLTDSRAGGSLADPVPRRPCASCGHPFTPLPAATLARAYGSRPPAQAASDLCAACRRKALSAAIRGGLR